MDYGWVVINKTVIGASHKRSGTICQDYGLIWQDNDSGLPIISVIADGHGSKKYIRSDVGSKIACNVALEIAKQYCNNFFSIDFNLIDFNLIKEICSQNFKKDVICSWNESILLHAANNIFTDDELSLLSISRDDDSLSVLSKIIRAYGSTLIIVVILDNFILSWQLGDGDIVFYFKDGRLSTPVAKDPQLIANETFSLCSTSAFHNMRFNIHYLFNYEDIPDLIMMSTDGYCNSFNSSEDFYKVPVDFYNLLQNNCVKDIEESLANWLEETSEQGSGDDITLVLISKIKK